MDACAHVCLLSFFSLFLLLGYGYFNVLFTCLLLFFFGTFPFPCLFPSLFFLLEITTLYSILYSNLMSQVSGNSLYDGQGTRVVCIQSGVLSHPLKVVACYFILIDPLPQTPDTFKSHMQGKKSRLMVVSRRLSRRHHTIPWLAGIQSGSGNQWVLCLLRYCPSFSLL